MNMIENKPVEWVFIDWGRSAETIRRLMRLFSNFHPEDIRVEGEFNSPLDARVEIVWASHEIELRQGCLLVFHSPNWLFVFKPDNPKATATILRDESHEPYSGLFGGL